jgi:hypothetical protein
VSPVHLGIVGQLLLRLTRTSSLGLLTGFVFSAFMLSMRVGYRDWIVRTEIYNLGPDRNQITKRGPAFTGRRLHFFGDMSSNCGVISV